MTPRFDIVTALRSWDGRDVLPFQDVAAALPATSESVSCLVDIARQKDEACQVGATWVIKFWVEQGLRCDRRLSGRLAGLLERRLFWGATLHLLILLPLLDLTAARWRALRPVLEAQRTAENTFVRAWAYNGLGVLAQREPALQGEIDALFERAMATEKAAVRARIRNARKAW